jgi:hypothetical protein
MATTTASAATKGISKTKWPGVTADLIRDERTVSPEEWPQIYADKYRSMNIVTSQWFSDQSLSA